MKISITIFLGVMGVLSQSLMAQPNILMIAVDDLNDWIGVYGGHPQCQTPHMDRFAEKAMVFRNASCPGPVCGPSRAALLSGFMPANDQKPKGGKKRAGGGKKGKRKK